MTLYSLIKAFLFRTRTPGMIRSLSQIRHTSDRIFLIGTPVHGNLGDHLIAETELNILTKLNNKTVIECTMEFCDQMWGFFSRNIKEGDIIAISGGGWLGTEWKKDELFVRKVISTFPDNKIVILPQTVFYKNDHDFEEKGKKIYAKHDDLQFILRDRSSYRYILDNGFVKKEKQVYLMADMALLSDRKNIKNHRTRREIRIGVCLRNDIEGEMTAVDKRKVIDIINKYDASFISVTTYEPDIKIYPKQRQKAIDDKLKCISRLSLLVTDRLHAMIMAAIVGTPCIAFDNSTHKVVGVYDWIKRLDYIHMMRADDKFEDVIDDMLKTEFHSNFADIDQSIQIHRLKELFSV